jgi:hypothetical protein
VGKKRTACRRSIVEQEKKTIIFVEHKHQIWKILMADHRRNKKNMKEED